MWTFGRNLLLIKFGSERVKETKWTGLSARIRALFLKKIVIAVFDFGPEKHALHYTRHDTWTDSQEEGQQLNMATQCVFCEMTTWRRGGWGGGGKHFRLSEGFCTFCPWSNVVFVNF